MRIVFSFATLALSTAAALADNGGTNMKGCHKNNVDPRYPEYHCHKPKTSSSNRSYDTPRDYVRGLREAPVQVPIDHAVERFQDPIVENYEKQKQYHRERQSTRFRNAREVYEWEWQQYLKEWEIYRARPAILRGVLPVPPEPLAPPVRPIVIVKTPSVKPAPPPKIARECNYVAIFRGGRRTKRCVPD